MASIKISLRRKSSIPFLLSQREGCSPKSSRQTEQGEKLDLACDRRAKILEGLTTDPVHIIDQTISPVRTTKPSQQPKHGAAASTRADEEAVRESAETTASPLTSRRGFT